MDAPNPIDPAAIGARVRERRERLGLSQRALARRVGVSVAFVSCVERGERLPSLETLARLADCLGLSLDELALGRGPCLAGQCALMRDLRALVEKHSD